ncbi:hypothetical protein BIY22_01360 [Vibrio panuliri]|uniref:Carbohydrate kinase n=1 Tax=Vibrio panuliri TaxID=1381081 RepID=A0A1Q9HQQ4_9VIBR|nr:FGGY family carbohydrate kinase [Vibrio panuliri]OLQ93166.1 hypothetical protein BIY22_01360 [Vibrio panuliri]
MEQTYYLGIDIGTYSSKGVLVDTYGEIIAQHSIAHELSVPHEGFAEHDAMQVWWGEFQAICRELISLSGIDAEQIKAVGHSAMSPCLVCADEQGKPLHAAILYGIDTRASEQQQQMYQLLGQDNIYQLSGGLLSSQSVVPKMLWVKQHMPKVWNQTHYLFSASGFITYQLTNHYCLDCYDAIAYSGIYNCHSNSWDLDSCQRLGINKPLPQLHWATEIVGKVTEDAARATGLKVGTPVLTGCADAGAEALSAGVMANGDTMLMYGSSTFFITRTPYRISSPIFWSNCFLEPDTYVVTGGTATCGSLLTWYLNQFGSQAKLDSKLHHTNPHAELMKKFEHSAPGANGLICLPYFSGERTPILDSDAKGMLFGLTLGHTDADIYRSVVEGIAMSITHNIRALGLECEVKRLLAVGGGVNNHHLLQSVSDFAQVEQSVSDRSVGASYGNCMMAAVCCGQFECLDEAVSHWVKFEQNFKANPPLVELERNYEIYLHLYQANRELMHGLSS